MATINQANTYTENDVWWDVEKWESLCSVSGNISGTIVIKVKSFTQKSLI